MKEEQTAERSKVLTVDEIYKKLPVEAIPPNVLIQVLMLLAEDYHCGTFCIDFLSIDVSTGKVSHFEATSLTRNRSAGLAPGDEVTFLEVPEGISDDVKAAKRGCYKVRICWRGDRVGGSGSVSGPIDSWRELNKDDKCCQRTEDF